MKTAEIYEFPVPESEGDEIERLRASMKEWHATVYGGNTPLSALVWHEVDAAMKNDDLRLVRNAAAAFKEFDDLWREAVPF